MRRQRRAKPDRVLAAPELALAISPSDGLYGAYAVAHLDLPLTPDEVEADVSSNLPSAAVNVFDE